MFASPALAVNAFKEQYQQAVACVSDAVLLVSQGGYRPSPPGGLPHSLALAGRRAPLSGNAQVALVVRHHYRVVRAPGSQRNWQVETAAYYHALDDADEREILAYHWHPMVESVAFPHLHFGPGAVSAELLARAQLSSLHNALRLEVAVAHLPTGLVSLADVLRLAITQFHVPPRRADWDAVLQL